MAKAKIAKENICEARKLKIKSIMTTFFLKLFRGLKEVKILQDVYVVE